MVPRVSTGLKPRGDCVSGSGEVPHDELAPPMFEFDEADGELVDAPPTAYCESMLTEPFDRLPVRGGVYNPAAGFVKFAAWELDAAWLAAMDWRGLTPSGEFPFEL